MFHEIVSRFRTRKAEEKRKRLLVKNEVRSLIVGVVTGSSKIKPEEAEKLIDNALEAGVVSDTQASEIHEVASAGFGYLKAGETKPVDVEKLLEDRAAIVARHREEISASNLAISEAQSHNAAILEARQQFARLANEQPEIAEELTRQVSLTWKPKITKYIERPTQPGTSVTQLERQA